MRGGLRFDDPARPECTNLLNMYQAATAQSRKAVEREVAHMEWSTFKPLLADALVAQRMAEGLGGYNRPCRDAAKGLGGYIRARLEVAESHGGNIRPRREEPLPRVLAAVSAQSTKLPSATVAATAQRAQQPEATAPMPTLGPHDLVEAISKIIFQQVVRLHN